MSFDGWNLIKIAGELIKIAREIAKLEAELARLESGTWESGTLRADRIAEIRRRIADARARQQALEAAKSAKEAARKLAEEALKRTSGSRVLSALSRFGTRATFGLLKGTAATVAGGLIATAILAGATYGVATAAGALSGDSSVQPGIAMRGNHERNVDDPVIQKKSTEPYGVFVGGGYNEVIVGQESVIMGATTSSLIGWGRDSSKTVKDTGATFRMVLGPFKTAEEARRAFDENLEPGSERIKPFASGRCARFKFDGKEHDIDNAFRLIE